MLLLLLLLLPPPPPPKLHDAFAYVLILACTFARESGFVMLRSNWVLEYLDVGVGGLGFVL